MPLLLTMPEIARVGPMIISVYWDDHPHDPHFHVRCGDGGFKVRISDATIIRGNPPPQFIKKIRSWTKKYRTQLLEAFTIAQNRKRPPYISDET